jgi:hypothetical protein
MNEMKGWSRFFVVLLFLSICGSLVSQAGDFNFRFNLKKGEKFDYVYTSTDQVDPNMPGISSDMEQQAAFTFSLRVVRKLKDGGYKLEAEYRRLVMHIAMNGNRIDYHSDSVYQSNPYADLLKGFNKIHYTFDISPVGLVSHIEGFDEWAKKMQSDVRLSNMLKGLGTEAFMTGLLHYLPQTPVIAGGKWVVETQFYELKELKQNITYTLDEVTARDVKIGLKSQIDYQQPPVANNPVSVTDSITQHGNMLLDAKSLMPVSFKIVQVSNLMITRTNPRTQVETTIPMTIRTEKSLKLLAPR